MFSYKAQVDDGVEDDIVSLPHQHSFSSLKTDSDYIYQVGHKIVFKLMYIVLSASLQKLQMTTFLGKCGGNGEVVNAVEHKSGL